jgi:putative membrane protein
MSVLHRTSTARPDSATGLAAGLGRPVFDGRDEPGSSPRIGAAWFGICTAALMLVVLIILMPQNTHSVEVNLLWMHGNLPLALALLIAGVGLAILAVVVGIARITQLRRLSHRQDRHDFAG